MNRVCAFSFPENCHNYFFFSLQETNIEPVHVTGAFLVFGLGTVYGFIQAGLSYQMYPEFNGVKICRVRLIISFIALVGLFVSILGNIVY